MILLGLGSNLDSSFGDRFKNIDLAIEALIETGIIIIKKSSYYESASYPNKNNPKFINIVVSIDTKLSPENLASILIFVEKSLERKRGKKNDPRTCDIDIIDFNSEVKIFTYKNHKFIVPHKNLAFRNFVLYPLQEILPKWTHPQTNESIKSLISKLDDDSKKSILKLNKS